MMFSFAAGVYEVSIRSGDGSSRSGLDRAALVDRLGSSDDLDGRYTLAVSRADAGGGWPFLVIELLDARDGWGLPPGSLLVPETGRLFVGAGERLAAYDLTGPSRLWEDSAACGFWCWRRHGDIVLMCGELELAAWDLAARKLWSVGVEPPWTYSVAGPTVTLDVDGREFRIDLRTGAPADG